MPNGHTTPRIRLPDDYHHSFANATPVTPTPYSTLNTTREGILIMDFTDDDEDNDSSYHSYDLGQIQSIGANVGEDVVRTGETSRLRRRGAVHGRRPQPSYVTLICGAPLPWRFKSKGSNDFEYRQTSNPKSLMQRYESLKSCPSTSQHLSLEFPSTGCRSILTSRAYVSSTHRVYGAQVGLENVAVIDKVYLDEAQQNTVAELLVDSWGPLDWQGLACTECGNLIGFRYAPATLDEEGNLIENSAEPSGYTSKERFAFFPSAVTSSKPYDFTTQQHYSNPYYWRYLEPLTTTSTSPNRSHSSESTLRAETRGTIDSSSQVTQLYQSHHPTSFLQHRFGTIPFPFTSHDGTDVYFRQPRPLPSLPTRSMSSLASSFDAPRHGTWSGGEFLHTVHEPEQQVDDPWAAWHPDPSFAAADDDQTVGDVIFPETASILRITHNDIATELQAPLSSSLEFEPRRLDDGDILRHSDAGSGNASTSLDMLQGLHAPRVSPVGDEHEQASSDHHHAFMRANSAAALQPISSPSQQQHLVLHDGSSVDDSQVHPGSERVNDNLAQRSDMIPVLQQEIRSESTSTMQSGTVLSPAPSNTMLPIPTPIAYESSATRVDIGTTGEGTNEMENVVLSVGVAAPYPDSTSDFGSAVIVPSLVGVDQLNFGTTLPEAVTGPLSVSIDQSNQSSSSLEESSNMAADDSTMEIPNTSTNNPIGETQGLDASIGAIGTYGIGAPVQYHQYTPPVPPLSLGILIPSLPSSPSRRPSTVSLPSPDSHILLPFVGPVEDGSLSEHVYAELDVPHERHDMENTFASGRVDEAETHQPHLEQSTLMEPGYSMEHSCPLEDRFHDNAFISQTHSQPSSSSSPSRLSSSSLPRHIITTAPVSHPQTLPASPPTLHEMMSPPVLPVSRRMSRHASYTTSSAPSQHRSSSRRSWRTPREFLESPVSAEPAENGDVGSSANRTRSSSSRDSGTRNDRGYAIEIQPSVGASRRVRGQSRTRRRRLSSSSRRESRLSTTSAGSTFRTLPSELVRHSAVSQMSALTPGTQNQLRMGDSLRRLHRLTASPELIRRGSLPNIERPRLPGLVRRDSLPVLSMQREPLSDLTANFRQQELRPIVSRSSTSIPNTRPRPSIRDRSPMSNRRHQGERLVLGINIDSSHGYDTDDRRTQEDGSDFGQENEPVNDPENPLTPRPRRHTTMPVFIPSPPSDSDSEPEDVNQHMDGVSFSHGPTLVPWMPWEWCWQDQRRNPSENGLRVDVHATRATGESDKED